MPTCTTTATLVSGYVSALLDDAGAVLLDDGGEVMTANANAGHETTVTLTTCT